MKKHFLIIFLISLIFNSNIYTQQITNHTEISIITCAPGDELYSTFGHSAIRIKDPSRRIDNVYNYGTFNFETPNFYMKFARGQLDYMLTVSPYKYFVISYMNENRWIKEQVLNLSLTQKQEIYIFLQNNALPENMYYRYDFFYDNCATRIKDVIKNVLDEDLILADSITEAGETFRDLITLYLEGKNWERLAINLALGQPADKIITTEEATFLPDYTEMFFDGSFVILNGRTMPLVKDKRMLYNPESKLEKKSPVFTPTLIFWFIFSLLMILTVIELKSGKYFLNIDKTLFFISGFIGIMILLLWFGTEHKAVLNNWNIIWTIPLYLIAAFALRRKNNLPYIRLFLLIWSVLLLISLITDLALYNIFDNAFIPIIFILLIRSQLIYFFHK